MYATKYDLAAISVALVSLATDLPEITGGIWNALWVLPLVAVKVWAYAYFTIFAATHIFFGGQLPWRKPRSPK